jgi:outer membrane protein assembly factor BamD
MFKEGVAYNKQAKTSEYDQSIAAKAIAVFTDFMTLHPQDPRVTEAQDYVSALKTEQARGSYEIAKYYEKKKRWKAALIYYNEVLLKDPNSVHAESARRNIDMIQAKIPAPAMDR